MTTGCQRLFLPGKCNLAAPPSGLAFGIGGEPARVQWEPLPVDVKSDDVIRRVRTASRPGPEAKARSAAEDWLRELLANGPLPTKQVRAEAKAAGLCWRTVRRASEALGVKARKQGFAGCWTWQLPDG
ncbi:MAG: hypothetical protein NZM31_11520 [Gemmatales bacterium]|nr:hypothetical protein [Gemmatales bacterium]MDW8387624.1 hypothetical protein [Gemmatales bacterium]